jgi:hypothetical protein
MSARLDAAEAGAWRMPQCPGPSDWQLDWSALLQRFAWLRGLAECPQDPIYHAEGDVLIHTRMICEALVDLPAWRRLQPQARSLLFAAALLHDIGKPACTLVEGDGRITARGHARAGSRLAQEILYVREPFVTQPVPFAARLAIVGLVRHHGLPPYLLDRDDPERAVITASQEARCDWLALLAEADVRGRQCRAKGDLLDRVALFSEFAQEQGCLSAPHAFASGLSRFIYFQGAEEYVAYDDSCCEVVLLSGLPGAGKDTYAPRTWRTGQ